MDDTHTVWVPLLVSVIGTLISLVVGKLLTIRIFGPRLNVVFRGGDYGLFPTPRVATYLEEKPISPNDFYTSEAAVYNEREHFVYRTVQTDVLYIRLTVENTGRENASKCRAYLTAIEKPQGNHIFFDSIPLCWSWVEQSAPQVFDIPRNACINLDLLLCHPIQPRGTLQPCMTVLTMRYQALFADDGDYFLTVVVSAKNASPTLSGGSK